MYDIFILLPPILTLIVISVIKILSSEFQLRGFGLDSNIIGVMYIYPLPIISQIDPALMQTILLGVTFIFSINAICFVLSKKLRTNKRIYERVSLTLGLIVFGMGLILIIIF